MGKTQWQIRIRVHYGGDEVNNTRRQERRSGVNEPGTTRTKQGSIAYWRDGKIKKRESKAAETGKV